MRATDQKPGRDGSWESRVNKEIAAYLMARVRIVGDCWEWTGTRRGGRWNYGLAQIRGKEWRAHRLSYVFYIGPIPERMQVCHHCDNPPCINPAHLFLGTNADNVHDCMAKGRDRKGDRRGERSFHKLSLSDAIQILRSPERVVDLAKIYGVTKTTICDIRRGRTWEEAHQAVNRPAADTAKIIGER